MTCRIDQPPDGSGAATKGEGDASENQQARMAAAADVSAPLIRRPSASAPRAGCPRERICIMDDKMPDRIAASGPRRAFGYASPLDPSAARSSAVSSPASSSAMSSSILSRILMPRERAAQ